MLRPLTLLSLLAMTSAACSVDSTDAAVSDDALRQHVSGTRDADFGDDGVDRSPDPSATYELLPVPSFVDKKGRTVASVKSPDGALSVERRLADGTLDPTFGDGGTTLLLGFAQDSNAIVRLLPDAGGRFLALRVDRHEYRYGGTKSQMARIREDGLPDVTFAKGGFFNEGLLNHEEALVTALRVPSDGSYVLVGSRSGIREKLVFQTGCYLDTYFVRLNRDGERIRSFDEDGVVVHRFVDSSEIVGARLLGGKAIEVLGVSVENKGWSNRCHTLQTDSDGPRYAARIWL